MKIAVCIKQVVDTIVPIILPPSVPALPEEELSFVPNEADLHALEVAASIKDSWPGAEVILVSLGPPRVEKALRTCFAQGADRALHLWDDAFANSDALVRSQILARAVAGLQADLVLCGSRSEDEREGIIPGMLAELLGLPCVSAVSGLEIAKDGKSILVKRKLEHGNRELVRAPIPALLAIEPGINSPRYPSVHARLRARRHLIEKLGMAELGLADGDVGKAGSPTSVVKLGKAKNRPKKTFTMDASLSSEDRLKMLQSGGAQEKKTVVWEGAPQELAQRLVAFLAERDMLSS